MISSSLLTTGDLLHFMLCYSVLMLAPGYAVAVLTGPRTSLVERLAFAVPCAYSLVAVSGLATALLHLPFDLPHYAILALPLIIAGGVAIWRARPRFTVAGIDTWSLVPFGVALAQIAICIVMFAGYIVPVGFDTVVHVQFTDLISRSHIFPISLISSRSAASDGPFYPAAFHAVAALVLNAAPMPTYRAVFLSVMCALPMFPLALFVYVKKATGSARIGAFASLASLAFEPLPLFALAQGLYPVTIALLFIPTLALALYAGLGQGHRRAMALAALLGIGLLYIHPTEFVAVGLPALAIVPPLLRDTRAWRRAGAYAVALLVIWGIAALPALTAVHNAVKYVPVLEQVPAPQQAQAHLHLGPVAASYVQWIYGRNLSYPLLIVVIIGALWCLARRRFRGLVLVQALAFILFIDVSSVNLIRKIPLLHVVFFHWTLLERLTPLHYWLVLPLAALGIDFVLRAGARLWRGRHPLALSLVASPLVLLGVVLPCAIAVERVSAYSSARNVVAQPDMQSLAWLARHAATGSTVLNDADMAHPQIIDGAIDAGLWLPVLNGPQPVFWRSTEGTGDLQQRLNLLHHIMDRRLPVSAARFMRQYKVRYVFYGARVSPIATRHLNVTRLLGDPYLRLVFSTVPTCLGHTAPRRLMCPPTGSYVFAVTA